MNPKPSTSEAGYTSRIHLTKAPDDVFDALSTVTGVAAWWSPAKGSAEQGGELRLDHNHPDPLILRVDTVERPHSIVWTVLDYPLNPEWVGTRIEFSLKSRPAGGTELAFYHHGLTPQLDCYDHCSRGWDYYLPSLGAYMETGTGKPT